MFCIDTIIQAFKQTNCTTLNVQSGPEEETAPGLKPSAWAVTLHASSARRVAAN